VQLLTDILEREKDFHVQTLIAERPIGTFDESILDRLAGPDKVQLNTLTIGPRIHDAAGKFTPIVHRD
jgi:hypothetical protein